MAGGLGGLEDTTNPNHSVISAWEAQQHQNLDMFMLLWLQIHLAASLDTSSLKGHRSAFSMANLIVTVWQT